MTSVQKLSLRWHEVGIVTTMTKNYKHKHFHERFNLFLWTLHMFGPLKTNIQNCWRKKPLTSSELLMFSSVSLRNSAFQLNHNTLFQPFTFSRNLSQYDCLFLWHNNDNFYIPETLNSKAKFKICWNHKRKSKENECSLVFRAACLCFQTSAFLILFSRCHKPSMETNIHF
jgi:hypothetical protein